MTISVRVITNNPAVVTVQVVERLPTEETKVLAVMCAPHDGFERLLEALGTLIRDSIAASIETNLNARLFSEWCKQSGKTRESADGSTEHPVLTFSPGLTSSIARDLANNAAMSLAGQVELIEGI